MASQSNFARSSSSQQQNAIQASKARPSSSSGYQKKVQHNLAEPQNQTKHCIKPEEDTYPILNPAINFSALAGGGVGHFYGDCGDLPPRFAEMVRTSALDIVLKSCPENLIESLLKAKDPKIVSQIRKSFADQEVLKPLNSCDTPQNNLNIPCDDNTLQPVIETDTRKICHINRSDSGRRHYESSENIRKKESQNIPEQHNSLNMELKVKPDVKHKSGRFDQREANESQQNEMPSHNRPVEKQKKSFEPKSQFPERNNCVTNSINVDKSTATPTKRISSLDTCLMNVIQVIENKQLQAKRFDNNALHVRKEIRNDPILEQYFECIEKHQKKIALVEEDLRNLNNKRRCKDAKYLAIISKLEALKDMSNISENYYRKKNQTVKNRSSDKIPDGLILECHFLESSLPIYSKKEFILDTVQKHQVSVLVAATGSGKSTQIVQYLLQAGYHEKGYIVCTQPRKVAAINLCDWVSKQIGSPPGEVIGFETGLRKKVTATTKVIYITDFALLKRCVYDKSFKGISCIVVDEAHERTLHTDLILGMIKRCIQSRKDLKIIITSATIEPTIFVDYFGLTVDAVLKIPGRNYPVDVVWQEKDASIGWDYLEACVEQAYKIHCYNSPGDILVFLTSPSETQVATSKFQSITQEKGQKNKMKLIPDLYCFHGRQESTEQLKIFAPTSKGHRKIIFATNCAETSITISGVKYVVDSGMMKEMQYDKDRKRNALVVTFINRSSAEQRMGRAGRTEAGICYRMYTKKNYKSDMSASSIPEILQTSLQQAVLTIIELDIQPMKFDYINAPDTICLEEAINSLEYLGALKKCKNTFIITSLGKKIVRFPLEPFLAKLVIRGIEEKIGYECMVIAALASISGRVFFRNEENWYEADAESQKFYDSSGDFCTFLVVFYNWCQARRNDQHVSWCQTNYINGKSMRVSHQIVNELCEIASELKLSFSKEFLPLNKFLQKSKLVFFECFSENLCVFSGHEKTGYVSPFLEGSFFIHPSSALYRLGEKLPQFVIYSTVLKTSRDFLLNVAPVDESTIVEAYRNGKFPFQIDVLKSMQVGPVVIQGLGEVLLVNHILGRDGIKMKRIEEDLQTLIRMDAFYIDVSPSRNEVSVYADSRHRKQIKAFLDKIVEGARSIMAKEDEICSLSCTHFCLFIVGIGAHVHDVVLPGEYREIEITFKSDFGNVRKLKSLLETYGIIVSYSEAFCEDSTTIHVTFQNVEQAQNAVHCLQRETMYCISPRISLAETANKTLPLFRIRVTWNRSSCKGHGWVRFYNSIDFHEASFILSSNPFYIDDRGITFTPSKDENTLYMNNLSSNAEQSCIKTALVKHLPKHIQIKSVELSHERIYNTNANDINIVISRLKCLFSPFAFPNNLLVDVKHPQNSDTQWKATVYFMVSEEGEKAFTSLGKKNKMGQHNVTLTPVLESSLHCKNSVYRTVRTQLDEYANECRKSKQCDNFKINQKNGLVDILFSCPNLANLRKTHEAITKLIGCLQLSHIKNPELAPLFSKNYQVSFVGLERDTKTVIHHDRLNETIYIYGTEIARKKAEQEIKCQAASAASLCTKVFELIGEDMPSGFIKTMYNKYGYKLEGLLKKFSGELKTASINILRHELILKGSLRVLNQVEAELNEMCADLIDKTRKKKQKENLEICPICLDFITSGLTRLESCGHAVCVTCLTLQLKSEVFPVCCVQKDCGKPYFLADLKKVWVDDTMKSQFCDAAFKTFVHSNSKIRYCPTPDCEMVYRVPRNDSSETQHRCVLCENEICIRCHVLYHHGMSCDIFQKSQTDEHYSLRVWQREDAENRRNCPSCSMALEKDGGCNHVMCESCKSHLCWLCLRIFRTSDEVYDHLPSCPSQ